MKTYTLEIYSAVTGRRLKGLSLVEREVVAEVDHDSTGFINEIRVYSELFGEFVATPETWLENNFPAKLATIRDAVAVAVHEAAMPKLKSYNNDDPNPAA